MAGGVNHHQAIGRRKESVARVRLIKGPGQITVNGKPISTYFPGLVSQKIYQRPFELTNTLNQFAGSIKIEGGGFSSQLGAVVHGLARTLEKINKSEYRPKLKNASLLTRDPRVKERRKVGQGGRARAKKQSPKR